MPRFARVDHSQWIEAPEDVVRAQFADLDHHIRANVHPKLRFEVLERHEQGARFAQEVRLLGMRQRDVFERRIEPDGSMVDRSIEGFNKGGTLTFRFVPQNVAGKRGTRVDITIRLPLPPVIGGLVRPLLEAQIRKEVAGATLEDRADIEQRGYPRRLDAAQAQSEPDRRGNAVPHRRFDVAFASDGETCRAWWYEPEAAHGACVVMAHGLGGVRTAGLEPYARRFAEAGFAVLLFDYRHFGASDGEPRQLVSIRRQLDDWAAAIAFARSRPVIDPDAIALWGSSFSGGHVIAAAARDGRVAAVCAQGPMMDGLAATLNIMRYAGVGQVLRLALRGLHDTLRASLGLHRIHVPLVGPPGTLATMTTPDSEPGYRSIAGPDWKNGICASFALALAFYRPVAMAHRVQCPALLIVVDDSVAPASAAVRTARRLGSRCEVHTLPIGHFDLYTGAGFEQGSALQLGFLRRVLAGVASSLPMTATAAGQGKPMNALGA